MARRALVVIVITLAFLVPSCTPEQFNSYDLVNKERSTRGIDILIWDEAASVQAQDWAAAMAISGGIRHSGWFWVSGSWVKIGENVGRAVNGVPEAHEAFMGSPSHRAVILDPDYTHLGTGVVRADGWTYVVHRFVARP